MMPASMALPRRLAARTESNSSGKSVTTSKWTAGTLASLLVVIDHQGAGDQIELLDEPGDRRHQELLARVRNDGEDVLASVPEGVAHAAAWLALEIEDGAAHEVGDVELTSRE